jgi:hypothetical protein
MRSVIERRHLAIYLQDHRAGAMAGVEMARRLVGSNEGTSYEGALVTVRDEIQADVETLERLMDHLDVKPNRAKLAAAWSGEKLGRLKLNGHLTGYSPLSRLVELEFLHIGITGKMSLWRALEWTFGDGLAEFDLPGLIERAETQRTSVERMRIDAAAEAFAAESA